MGICLDTEQNNEERESELQTGGGGRSAWASGARNVATPPAGNFPMQNSSKVKFEPPKVPVIFVLGGPGSGKVTHCDNLMQEKRGVVHINMTDLLQQYAIGNDMQDFGTLSSKTVTEVLMLEMKMAPTAKTYLVSGYPRSMRDVAEYSDKIQAVNGVVLVSWRQRVLERQIDYGAKLGHVVLSLAKMELKNFYKNVMPVADYFDQSNMLIAVNGERNPEEVYKDFRAAILQILGSLENQSAVANGMTGVGAAGIPGEIVGIEPAPAVIPVVSPQPMTTSIVAVAPAAIATAFANTKTSKPEMIRVRGADDRAGAWPAIVCVIGGPGSNKAALCQRAVTQLAGWAHFSLGQRLRSLADSPGGVGSEPALSRAALGGGELASRMMVLRLVREALTQQARAHSMGIVVDGYPRDMEQLEELEKEFNQTPRMILLDCSKLQLGRGRRDDSVAAFRRRLELFRELSLPMLKNLDAQQRLTIVDGDTDAPDVQAEFTRVLHSEMRRATGEDEPSGRTVIPTLSQQVSEAVTRISDGLTNGMSTGHPGHVGNGDVRKGNVMNGTLPNGVVSNGFIGMAANRVKPMVNVVPKMPTVSQMDQESIRRLYEHGTADTYTMDTHM